MHTETLIIGGGLSGLSVAANLAREGRDFYLLEARDRLGGRILSQQVSGAGFDLGPAWFWPGQPRIAQMISALGLEPFEQFADGILTHEDAEGRVERGRGFSSMQGSYRLKGGFGALIDALAAQIPADQVRLSSPVTRLQRSDTTIRASTETGMTVTAKQVVLALPPRLISGMRFSPALPAEAHHAMDSVATWMAGQAKAVAVYDSAFWRDAGLSGDAMSRFGPMVEVHDASADNSSGPFALFGFIGVPPAARQDQRALEQAIRAQLVRLFGPQAGTPRSLLIKDWAFEAHTSTRRDQDPLFAHPTYGLPEALRGLWQDRLIFAGTETAPAFGGYLEGALEAAENALAQCARERV